MVIYHAQDMPELGQKILGAITGLGTTADDIAATLGLEHIQAKPGNPRECALSAFAQKHFGDHEELQDLRVVYGHYCPAGQLIEEAASLKMTINGQQMEIRLPAEHWRFIQKFDSNQYPKLVKEPLPPAVVINSQIAALTQYPLAGINAADLPIDSPFKAFWLNSK